MHPDILAVCLTASMIMLALVLCSLRNSRRRLAHEQQLLTQGFVRVWVPVETHDGEETSGAWQWRRRSTQGD